MFFRSLLIGRGRVLVAVLLGSLWVYGGGGQAQDAPWLHLPASIMPNSRLIGLHDQQFVFQATDNSEVRTPTLVGWGHWPGVVGHQAIWLSDGSWLAGTIDSINEESIHFRHRWLELNPIPLSGLRAILYSPVASLGEWVSVSGPLSELQGDSETIWLRDGSRISGVVHRVSEDQADSRLLTLEVDNEMVSIPWSDIALLAMSPTLTGPGLVDRQITQIGLTDGSCLNARQWFCKPQYVELDIPSLGFVRTLDPPEVLIRSISSLNRRELDKVIRTGAVQPASYKFLPDSELTFPLGVDRCVFGRPVIIGRGQKAGIANHALAMHSSSQAAFRWDQSGGKFLAELRLSDPADERSPLGDVVCKIFLGRGRELVSAAEFELSRKSGETGPILIDVDITGAQLVVLVVEKALFGQWGDHVYWLNARFFRF